MFLRAASAPTQLDTKSPSGLHKSNPIVCYTLVQAGVVLGDTLDPQTVSFWQMSWRQTEGSCIVEPGEGRSRASVDVTPEMHGRSSGHGFILQSLRDRGRFYKGK